MEFEVGSEEERTVEKNQLYRVEIDSPASIRFKNPSENTVARFLEIWFYLDDPLEATSSVGSAKFSANEARFLTVASGQGHTDSVKLSHDAAIHYFELQPNESFIFETLSYRSNYIWVLKGALSIDNYRVLNQDGVIITGDPVLTLNSQNHSTVLLIDLPGDPPLDEESEFQD